MEKTNLLILSFALLLMSISIVSAGSLSVNPTTYNINEEMNLRISESGFYAIEIKIPTSFIITSDPSNGQITGGIYRTVYTSDLNIKLRPTTNGTFTISGQITTGNGIEDLNSIKLTINSLEVEQSCPICPSPTSWSNCENKIQKRVVYSCSKSTNYLCVSSFEKQSCKVPNVVDPVTNEVSEPPVCDVGWKCKDSNNYAYQSSDCSWSSIQYCKDGCTDNNCIIPKEIKEQYPDTDLNITITEDKDEGNFIFGWVGGVGGIGVIIVILFIIFLIKRR